MAPEFDFARVVRAHFSFLERRGLRVSKVEPLLVRYEGPRAWVEISHEPREWSVDVEVGPIAIFDAGHSLASILAVFPIEPEPAPSFVTGFESRVTATIERQAALLKALPGGVLEGDADIFDQVGRAGAKAASEVDARWHCARADVAWLHQDYATVVAELRQIDVPLSPAKAKKLRMALRFLRGE